MDTPTLKPEYRNLFIDGRFVTASGGVENIVNPSDESVAGIAPLGTVADAKIALRAAQRAFDEGPWPQENRTVRVQKMRQLLDKVSERKSGSTAADDAGNGLYKARCG